MFAFWIFIYNWIFHLPSIANQHLDTFFLIRIAWKSFNNSIIVENLDFIFDDDFFTSFIQKLNVKVTV